MAEKPVEARFMDKTFVRGDCWLWTGSRNKKGYGYFGLHKTGTGRMRVVRAHRAAYELFVGPIPEGKMVLHTCDNPECVRPSHLYLGTHADNMRDRAERGRTVNPPRGTGPDNTQAKLTIEEVIAMRTRRMGGDEYRDIARDFGVSRTTVSQVCSGYSWGWLHEPEGWTSRWVPYWKKPLLVDNGGSVLDGIRSKPCSQ